MSARWTTLPSTGVLPAALWSVSSACAHRQRRRRCRGRSARGARPKLRGSAATTSSISRHGCSPSPSTPPAVAARSRRGSARRQRHRRSGRRRPARPNYVMPLACRAAALVVLMRYLADMPIAADRVSARHFRGGVRNAPRKRQSLHRAHQREAGMSGDDDLALRRQLAALSVPNCREAARRNVASRIASRRYTSYGGGRWRRGGGRDRGAGGQVAFGNSPTAARAPAPPPPWPARWVSCGCWRSRRAAARRHRA